MIDRTLVLSAFALGALGSAHCVAMCGGVAGLFCAAAPDKARHGGRDAMRYVVGYNAGRVISYGSAGIALGGAGSLALGHIPMAAPQYVLRGVAAIAMILVGLVVSHVLRVPPRAAGWGRKIADALAPLTRQFLPLRSPLHAAALGLVWGWMPCGLLYAGLALALTAGSAVAGGLVMLAFAAGTLPAMLLVGGAAQWIAKWMQSARVRAVAGLLLACSGTINGLVLMQQLGVITLPGQPVVAHCQH